jgi:hypothetical protein
VTSADFAQPVDTERSRFLGLWLVGVGGRNRVVMIWWWSVVSMSGVEGSVLEEYHGADPRRCAVSVVGWPWWEYQMMSRLWQDNPDGTVRSTALRTLLRACPTPRVFLTSKKVTSLFQRAG